MAEARQSKAEDAGERGRGGVEGAGEGGKGGSSSPGSLAGGTMGRWSLAGEVGWEATWHRGELGSRGGVPLPYTPPLPPSQAPRGWRVSCFS